MKRKWGWLQVVVLAGVLVWAPVVIANDGTAAAEEGHKSSPWWNWWSWVDDLFGLSIGGVSYGSGPNRVVGSDRLVHQPRTVAGVRAIELQGPIDIVLKQDPTEKLTLHTDDNIAPLIETGVRDAVLHIGVQPGASFRTRHPIGLTVELVQLGELKVFGSGDVTCAQFDSDLLEITVRGPGSVRIDDLHASALAVLAQGSGDIHLSGVAPKQGYVIEGSGGVDAEELAGRELAVRVAGSGEAKVWATDTLAVQISGSGNVCHRGHPALDQSLHGSGSVRACR